MAKANQVKFYLEKRRDKATGEIITTNVPIHLFFSYGGKRLQHYTGYRIDVKLWNHGTMRVIIPKKGREGFENGMKINFALDELQQKVRDIIRKTEVNGETITIGLLRERLKGGDSSGKKSFTEAFQEFIESSKLSKTNRTVSAIKGASNFFSEFSRKCNVRLEFDNIDQKFYDRLLEFCFNTKGFKNNYTGKLIKDLKAFLNWATEAGYNTKMDFKKKSFKKLKEEPEIIFLSWEELLKLYNAKFTKKEVEFEKVRDLFCFASFTGMRFSDVIVLEKRNIHNGYISYRVEKTEQVNNIPLNPYSEAILKKYSKLPGEKALPYISKMEINDLLKDILKKLKFNRVVEQVHYQGPKRIKTVLPLHEIVTFHVSKKTFMTNFLAKGGSLLTAMSITGNKDFKTAKRYYKVVDSLKAQEMARVFGK